MPDASDFRDRLIVALDSPDAHQAMHLVDLLEGRCGWFKIGLELYLAAGPPIVESLRRRGCSIFLDLKLHDIPNTVAAAIRSVSGLGASLLTVHASGGAAMLQAAAQAAGSTNGGPQLVAVTVLTSMDPPQLAGTGVSGSVVDQVLRLARLSIDCGIDALVTSAHELPQLRAALGPSPLLVVPGIRPAGSPKGDQSRVATPAEALAAGASRLVIGRPVTQAEDPAATFDAILSGLQAPLPAPGASPRGR